MTTATKRLIWFTEIASVTTIIDQLVKSTITSSTKLPIEIIPGYVQMMLFKNEGIAFSIPLPTIVIVPLVLLLILFGAFYLKKELDLTKPLALTAIGLIIGGTAGNLIDRFRFGYVIDFISIWKFPVFNIADAAITIGIGILILWYGVLEKR
ncbi:MAG: signal peptidase II [Candidatus Gracilibacteria bacterium]